MKNNTILNQRTMNKPFYRWTIGTLLCMLGLLLTACSEEIEYDQLYHDMQALNEWRVGTKVAEVGRALQQTRLLYVSAHQRRRICSNERQILS